MERQKGQAKAHKNDGWRGLGRNKIKGGKLNEEIYPIEYATN